MERGNINAYSLISDVIFGLIALGVMTTIWSDSHPFRSLAVPRNVQWNIFFPHPLLMYSLSSLQHTAE
jgi:hypothetical protein